MRKTGHTTEPRNTRLGIHQVKTAVRSVFLLFVISLLAHGSAMATHFRYGEVTAQRVSETITTVTYQLHLSLSWRLGTAPASVPFVISGGNTGSVTFTMTSVTDPSGLWENSTSSQLVTLNKTTTPTRIEFTGFTKLTTIANNSATNWDVYIILNTNGPGSTPVSSLPAIMNVPVGDPSATFMIPALDPDAGSSLTFGYPNLSSGPLAGETEPSGFSVDPVTGLATFNTMSTVAGQQYNALVTVTDNDGNQIMLDFLINIVSASAPPTFDYSVTPVNGQVFNVVVGDTLSFPVSAVNAGSSTTVSLSASGLTSYITTSNFSPAMPATGNPSTTTFTYIPTMPEVGSTTVLNMIATNNSLIQTSSAVTINVFSQPAPLYVASTPGNSTIRSIPGGVLHSDTITVQSSIGSNVSISYASVPGGASLSPSVPTPGANPAQTILTWTPAPADFGRHTLTYEASISSVPTIFSTLTYTLITDDQPVFATSPVTSVTACNNYSYNVAATDVDIPYGDTVEINPAAPLPPWLTITQTGNGTATLQGTPANSDAGTYVINLAAEDLYHHNYAPVVQTFTINVNPNIITGTPDICVGATTNLTDAISGGTWSSSDITLATVNPGGTVTGVSAGFPAITYTTVGGCITTTTVNIDAIPSAGSISGASTVCIGNIAPLTDAVSGGAWTSNNMSVATVDPSGNVTGVSAGAATISYSVTNISGCSNVANAVITVNPVYVITSSAGANGSISPLGAATVCLGDNATYTITASSGYHINDVLVDGGSVGAISTYVFTSVNATHTISATFASDCVAPAISLCPSNVMVSNDVNLCSALVTYTAATATGTSPVITYSQNSGTAFPVGTTTVTVTATNSCGTANCSFTVTVNDTQLPTIVAPAAITVTSCKPAHADLGVPTTGDNCGVASVTNDAPSVFPVGTTTVHWTVTDVHGNTAMATQVVTITAGSLTITPTITNVSCNGGSNGSIATTVGGGTPSYSYAWSTGATTSGLSAIAAGSYSVSVTDANGCTATGIYNITQPAMLSVTGTPGNVSCNGGSNGSVTTTVSGGTPSYAYAWSTGATTSGISAVTAGAYSVTVTDGNGCKTTGIYSITQPAVLGVTGTSGNVSCYGGNNGSATASAIGGTPAYAYLWSTGATTPGITTATSGTYSVTVTDANGCTSGHSFTITQPSSPLAISAVVTNATCLGGNGTVAATVTGGTAPYTYLWSNGATTATLTAVAGSYSVTVTDANGCTVSGGSYTIGNGTSTFTFRTHVDEVPCNGGTGHIDADLSGGSGPFKYTWTTGGVGYSSYDDFYGPAGTYTVSVTDAHGCTIIGSFTITEPPALVLSAVTTNVSCYGAGNGSINTTVTGGTPGYYYFWSTGSHAADPTGLWPGTYCVDVFDANGCRVSNCYNITQPSAISLSAVVTNVTGCYGNNNGNINTTVGGGTAPYTYLWSNGSTLADPTGLTAGTYTVIVTDANGCTKTATYTVTQPAPMSITAIITNVTCYGSSNGNINTTVTGGSSPYTYVWSNGSTKADPTSLPAGTYTVTVTDAHECSQTAVYTVTQPAAITITAVVTNVSCYGGSTGNINTTVTGGTPSYSYKWSNGSRKADPTGLAAGTYVVTVTDANGCIATASYTVTQPASLTTAIGVAPVYTVPGEAPYTIYMVYGPQSVTMSSSTSGGTGAYTYSWTPSSTCSTPTAAATAVSPTSATTYKITVTDANGCTASATQGMNAEEVICDNDGNIIGDILGDLFGHGHESSSKICLCHNGHTVSVDSSLVAADLLAGYSLGPCPGHGGGRESNPATNSGNGGTGTPAAATTDVIKVYPNPTEGTFSVEIPATHKDASIVVTDVTGRVIDSRAVTNNTGAPETFNLANIAKGMYFVKVNDGEKTDVVKLMIR